MSRSVWERTVGAASARRGRKARRRQALKKQREARRRKRLAQLSSNPARYVVRRRDSQGRTLVSSLPISNHPNLAKDFYQTDEWRRVRYIALVKHGRKCMLCGRTPPSVIIHVDHIKPRFKFPDLALDINNLQILCEDCNFGKGAEFINDFRPQGEIK